MFHLKQCLKVVSPTTDKEWVVPASQLATDEGGSWLHLRFTCVTFCRLIVAEPKGALNNSKAIKEIIKKRNEAFEAATAPGKSVFDDSDQEDLAAEAEEPRAKRRKAEKAAAPLSVEISLEGHVKVVLRAPKRRDGDIWVRCDDENVHALLQHLASQDHVDETTAAGAKRRGPKPRNQ